MNAGIAKNFKTALILLLVCATAFSIFKYVVTLREKYTLLKSLDQAKGQIVALEEAVEKEKELQNALAQENSTLKDALKGETQKLTQLDAQLQDAQKAIDQLTSQIALAKAENTALRDEKDAIEGELGQVSRERDTLKSRMSSIPELRKTIREVKIQMRKAKMMMRELTRKRRVIEGNRGYLVRNGKTTYPITKIKIEVLPAPATK